MPQAVPGPRSDCQSVPAKYPERNPLRLGASPAQPPCCSGGAALGEEERSQLLGQLRDAADERAKLNAKVSALAHQLREQRIGMHEQQR